MPPNLSVIEAYSIVHVENIIHVIRPTWTIFIYSMTMMMTIWYVFTSCSRDNRVSLTVDSLNVTNREEQTGNIWDMDYYA